MTLPLVSAKGFGVRSLVASLWSMEVKALQRLNVSLQVHHNEVHLHTGNHEVVRKLFHQGSVYGQAQHLICHTRQYAQDQAYNQFNYKDSES